MSVPRLLVGKVITGNEKDRSLVNPDVFDLYKFDGNQTDSIGLRRLEVQKYAIKKGYKYLTFIDPDDEIICEDYLRQFPEGDLITCRKYRESRTNQKIACSKIPFYNRIPETVCHGPMNIINLDLCLEHDIYYRDTWVDDPDFFMRYLKYVNKSKCFYTDVVCYNHVRSEGGTLSKSERFWNSCRELLKRDVNEFDEETYSKFKKWIETRL